MAKKPQNSTPLEPIAKYRTRMERLESMEYMDHPKNELYRKRLMVTMDLWGEKNGAIDLHQFLTEYKIPFRTWYDWVKKYEDLREYWKEIAREIGCRKRVGALTKQFEKEVAFMDMAKLAPEWEEILKEHAALKNPEAIAQEGGFVYKGPLTKETEEKEDGCRVEDNTKQV